MNIPNLLTFIRFILVPVFIYSFYNYTDNHYLIPLTIFIFAGLTDILDGYIARKYNQITKLGKLMDPLADKAMQLSALFVLALSDKKFIPLWILIVVLAKELFMIIGGGVLYKREVIVQANWYGKATTVLFFIAICIIIVTDSEIGKVLLIIAVIAALLSAYKYTNEYSKVSKSQKYLSEN
jgi:cardiolipin synthase